MVVNLSTSTCFYKFLSIEYLIHILTKAGACYKRTSDVFLECIVFLFFILCALTVLTVLGTSTSVSLFALQANRVGLLLLVVLKTLRNFSRTLLRIG